MTKYLVEKGADINAKDNEGYTPLHNAVRSFKTAHISNLEMVKYLVEKGANVNAKTGRYLFDTSDSGDAPLHTAISYPIDLDAVKYLIEKGADINSRGKTGNTPLHIAVLSSVGILDPVQYLVEKGADINAKNSYNKTPLEVAKEECSNCKGIIDFLKEKSTSRVRRALGDPTSIADASDHLLTDLTPLSIGDAEHIETTSQLAHVQDGANPPQAVPHNTISSFNGTILLVDVLIRWLAGQKPVSTTPVADLTRDQKVLIHALDLFQNRKRAKN